MKKDLNQMTSDEIYEVLKIYNSLAAKARKFVKPNEKVTFSQLREHMGMDAPNGNFRQRLLGHLVWGADYFYGTEVDKSIVSYRVVNENGKFADSYIEFIGHYVDLYNDLTKN